MSKRGISYSLTFAGAARLHRMIRRDIARILRERADEETPVSPDELRQIAALLEEDSEGRGDTRPDPVPPGPGGDEPTGNS